MTNNELVLAIAMDVSSAENEDQQTMKLLRWVAKLKLLGAQEAGDSLERLLADLRGAGWAVAAHNDYRLNGVQMMSWLFTSGSGRWINGEGKSDAEAVAACWAAHRAQQPATVTEPTLEARLAEARQIRKTALDAWDMHVPGAADRLLHAGAS